MKNKFDHQVGHIWTAVGWSQDQLSLMLTTTSQQWTYIVLVWDVITMENIK